MRILVTGGAGFLGSHLCDRLLADGHEVLCLDNFFTGRRENVMHLLDDTSFELVRHDVTEPILLEVDQIYNLACPASPVHYQYNPVKTVKTNVMGTINMLGLAKRVRARILQASTSEVYGDPEVHPQPEGYWGNVNPIGIRSCYDEGKRLAETLMMDYQRQNKVDTRIIRIFNTYGPRMLANDGRVISNFIVQALRGEELTIYGDGTQTRSFCYVDDLIEGMVRLMNVSEDAHPEADIHEPVNVGNAEEFTMSDLAAEIGRAVGKKISVRYCPLPADDPRQRRPDLSKAQRLLGWKPSISFQQGIRLTVDYFAPRISRESEPLAHTASND
jgi:UDP-glucuronate decarboxylase